MINAEIPLSKLFAFADDVILAPLDHAREVFAQNTDDCSTAQGVLHVITSQGIKIGAGILASSFGGPALGLATYYAANLISPKALTMKQSQKAHFSRSGMLGDPGSISAGAYILPTARILSAELCVK